MPPKLSDAVTATASTLPSNNDVVNQAAAQAAALLGVPYITSDSDDDMPPPPPPPSTTALNPTNTDSTLPPTEPICSSLPSNSNPIPTSSNSIQPETSSKSEPLIAQTDVTMTDNHATSQNGNNTNDIVNPTSQPDTTVASITQNDPPDSMSMEKQPLDQNLSVPNTVDTATQDTINVSRSCLDGVVQQLANRITELEQIRERKKQRVERLSSAAMMAQNTPAPMWPQSAAMVAAQNVLGAGAATGVPTTTTASIPANYVPPTTAPKVVVPAPPAPPPAVPEGTTTTGERKQSRYWTADEHERFLAAIKTCGAKNYVRIAELVGTRNAKQVRTHAQKFQKKLEREEAKRRDDLRRHGGAAAASSVSAAAVAAVAAAAAAMHQGGHLTPEQAAAYPQLLLPYAHHGVPMMMGGGGASVPPGFPPTVGLQRPPDGSSSTNDVTMERRHIQPSVAESFVAPETVAAAVAAEAAALGNRVYSQPTTQVMKGNVDGRNNKNGNIGSGNATRTNQASGTGLDKEIDKKKTLKQSSGTMSGSGSGDGVDTSSKNTM